MDEAESANQESRRSFAARLGIAALNLLGPGLGLLRLQLLRQALSWWLLGVGPFLLIILFWALSPVLGFGLLLTCVAIVAIASFAALIGSIWASWGRSRVAVPGPRPVWSRWYAILLAAVVTICADNALTGLAHRFYKPFYLPSEAMMPTLLKNDRIVASMRPPTTLRRGDIILFRVEDAMYIKRIAALPGDRIALRKGVVILNGQPVGQTPVPVNIVTVYDRSSPPPRGAEPSTPEQILLREQFPGERQAHEIFDSGPSAEDDYAETQILPGHVFVLGDNRDESADSRLPKAEMGVEQLSISDIRGTALFYTWGPSHKSGQAVH